MRTFKIMIPGCISCSPHWDKAIWPSDDSEHLPRTTLHGPSKVAIACRSTFELFLERQRMHDADATELPIICLPKQEVYAQLSICMSSTAEAQQPYWPTDNLLLVIPGANVAPLRILPLGNWSKVSNDGSKSDAVALIPGAAILKKPSLTCP